MRVLIVDDSSVFRTQIRKALVDLPGVEVVGSASSGKIALAMLGQKNIDLITLDINMPDMNGLETLRELRVRGYKTRVILFASRNARSAQETLEALRIGADDFVLKPEGETTSLDSALEQVKAQLLPKIKQFIAPRLDKDLRDGGFLGDGAMATAKALPAVKPRDIKSMQAMVVVVASSTGGPGALEKFLGGLKSVPRIPVLIAQHMPETFTKYLARRLTEVSKVDVREAINGEALLPKTVYLAPGNFHMRLGRGPSGGNIILLDQGPKVNSVRPAADLLFQSAAELYGETCAAFVLTGMGEDGLVGARSIKEAGGAVMIQDKASCIVWGMPAAVFNAGLHDAIGDIEQCGAILSRLVS